MDWQRSLSNSKTAMCSNACGGWRFLARGLSSILLLAAAAAWPVFLETCAPDHFVEGQSIYRAVHRHFRHKSLIDAAMQSASDGTVQFAPFGATDGYGFAIHVLRYEPSEVAANLLVTE